MTWQRNQITRRAVTEQAGLVPCHLDQPTPLRYSDQMIRNKTLHSAARVLLGAFVAAYAMSSVHVYAGVAKAGGPQTAIRAQQVELPAQPARPAAHQNHGALPEAGGDPAIAEMEHTDAHCQPTVLDPAVMLCKFHCQNAIQTLDHPGAVLADLAPVVALLIPGANLVDARKPLVDKAFRPEAAHHGGAPPPYASTARLRI